MGRLTEAAESLDSAADALDRVPRRLRRMSIFGPFVEPKTLRDEAQHLRGIADEIKGDNL